MARGPAGYGRYDDSPQHVGCPFAKSDMTPCVARDGRICLAGDPPATCVGCGNDPAFLIRDLAADYEPAREHMQITDPQDAAHQLAALVRAATEPAGKAPAG